MSEADLLQIYSGRCHCGVVCFDVELDISAGTGKCNCSFCTKARLWTARALPAAFRLTSGESELSDYRGNNPVAHHLFCRRCGTRPFEWVDMPNMFGARYYNINIACLDDLDIDELMAAPITYSDGRNDRWDRAPADTRGL